MPPNNVDLDAGEFKKLIPEDDDVEHFVEASDSDVFLTHLASHARDAAGELLGRDDRATVRAPEGQPLYVAADPDGNGATVPVDRRGISVRRESRRVVERPGDRANRRGELQSTTFNQQISANTQENVVNKTSLTPEVVVDRITVVPGDPENDPPYTWELFMPSASNRDFGADNAATKGYDPGLSVSDNTDIRLAVTNRHSSSHPFTGSVIFREGV